MEVLGGNTEAHHCRLLITTWPGIYIFQTTLALYGRLKVMVRLVFLNCGCCRIKKNYLVDHCTFLQLLNTVWAPFFRNFKQSDIETTWFWKWKSWSTKTRMLIPNMFCTLVQRPHHDLVPFSALQNNDLSCGLLESIHSTTTLIYPNFQGSKIIAVKGSKIIVVMILEPSTGTPGGEGF